MRTQAAACLSVSCRLERAEWVMVLGAGVMGPLEAKEASGEVLPGEVSRVSRHLKGSLGIAAVVWICPNYGPDGLSVAVDKRILH